MDKATFRVERKRQTLRLVVSIDGQRRATNLPIILCDGLQWDAKRQRATGEPQSIAKAVDAQVAAVLADCHRTHALAALQGVPLCHELFLVGSKPTGSTLQTVAQLCAAFMRDGLRGKSFATIQTYRTQVGRLMPWHGHAIAALNTVWVENEMATMRAKGLLPATQRKYLKTVRAMLNWAKRLDYVATVPAWNTPLPKSLERRQHLTMAQVERLHGYRADVATPAHLANTATLFLFSCFTGLRYSDLKGLTAAHINGGRIEMAMHKTKRLVCIPLSKRALGLLPTGYTTLASVFHVPTNQVYNRQLKEVGYAIGLRFPLTTHIGRHTFAHLSLNDLDVPLEVVSEWLGHARLETTRIYARPDAKLSKKLMAKWDFESS
jgi:integrase